MDPPRRPDRDCAGPDRGGPGGQGVGRVAAGLAGRRPPPAPRPLDSAYPPAPPRPSRDRRRSPPHSLPTRRSSDKSGEVGPATRGHVEPVPSGAFPVAPPVLVLPVRVGDQAPKGWAGGRLALSALASRLPPPGLPGPPPWPPGPPR